MSGKNFKILRYNTGSDKYAFLKFKDKFDAVLFNANIVVHSTSAIADIVSVHKNQYIIDPQTHIFQHPIKAIQTISKDKEGNRISKIKKSISNYLDLMPQGIKEIVVNKASEMTPSDININIDELIDRVIKFETSYINDSIEKKEYNKYLDFAGIGPSYSFLIAPYFMLKKEYTIDYCFEWLNINNMCLTKYINTVADKPIAAQLVISKDKLTNKKIINKIKEVYNIKGYEYIFIWIDDFSSWNATEDEKKSFVNLLDIFEELNKKPIMAYGGYDSILLCHPNSPHRLYGVAQSVGYGEARNITPVGGGFPTNKYYFFPLHQRMLYGEVADILSINGYFDSGVDVKKRTEKYYKEICNCKQCKEIINNNIENFITYNESTTFSYNTQYGEQKRNRPTGDAARIAAMHYMYCKVREWDELKSYSYKDLIKKLENDYKLYLPGEGKNIINWCKIYG